MFKKLFSNFANDLVRKLPVATKKFGIKYVENYYNNMFNSNPKRLTFQTIQTKYISTFLENCNINNAVGIDNLFGRFLKDGANILTIPITQIRNISIKFPYFLKN